MSGLFAWLVVLIIASVTAHYWEKYAREKAGQENWAEDKLWDEERDYEVLPKTICYIVQPITIIVGVIWLWGAMTDFKDEAQDNWENSTYIPIYDNSGRKCTSYPNIKPPECQPMR